MTYITLEVTDELIKLDMTGHAEYAEKGSDIVCSAISTLEFILYGYVETNPNEAFMKRYDTDTGYSYMRIIPKGSGIYEVIKSITIGFENIALEYPNNINFKKIWKSGRK